MTPSPTTTDADMSSRVGALLYDTSLEIEAILTTAIERLRARHITVGGLLQRFGEQLPSGKYHMWVEDLTTGETVRLDKPRGVGASACIVDPDALSQAACLLRRTIEAKPDLIIVNRFGHAEAEGGGMRAEIAEAVCGGATVLIAARFTYLNALEDFLGGSPTVLSPDATAVADWAEHAATIGQPLKAC